jgi:nucleotide-binding universal stress UspA family protein
MASQQMEDVMGTSPVHDTATAAAPELVFRHIAACINETAMSELVVPHALAIARAFGGRVTVVRVLECGTPGDVPTDPLEWDIRRREARDHVEHLAREAGADVPIAADVVESRAADEICLWAERQQVDLMVLCRCDAPEPAEWPLARTLLDQMPGSVLIVHAPVAIHTLVGRYRRLLVPVDGSPRAESVVPLAARVAASAAAELLVAHVVPAPGLTEIGPPDAEDIELRERITQRNLRIATAYLDRLRGRFAANGPPPRTMVLLDGDVRTRLERLVEDEAVDLVVVSSHGHTGRTGVPYGSVTADLVLHSSVPLLIVRPRTNQARTHKTMATTVLRSRLPHQAAS